MGAALPSAGLGVASLRERHGESLLWTGQSTGQVLQDGEAGVGSSAGARTFDHVAVAAACRAEATTIRAAERLHRQREGRLGLDQLRQVERVVRVEVELQVVGAELDRLLAALGPWREPRVDRGRDPGREPLEAAPAHLGHADRDPAPDHDVPVVTLDQERELLEAPRAVVKRLGQFIGALDREPVVGNLRDSNDHCRQAPPNTPRTMNFATTEPVYRAGSAKSRHLAVFSLPAPSHRAAVWYPLVLGRPGPCRTC